MFYFQRLGTQHTKATKDPDPFHQLYEQRKGWFNLQSIMAVFYSGLLHNIEFVLEILNFLKVLEII